MRKICVKGAMINEQGHTVISAWRRLKYRGSMMMTSSQRLNKHALGMIGLLVIQYVLGMIASLYVQLPAHADMSLGFAHGWWLVWVHIILGTIIVIGVISLYIRAVRAKDKAWKIAAGIGAIAVVLAWGFGDDFFTNQDNADSLAMSLFFIVVLVTLGWGVYKAKENCVCSAAEDQGDAGAVNQGQAGS